MVEDVGVEPLSEVPNFLCYRYTTSSVIVVTVVLLIIDYFNN